MKKQEIQQLAAIVNNARHTEEEHYCGIHYTTDRLSVTKTGEYRFNSRYTDLPSLLARARRVEPKAPTKKQLDAPSLSFQSAILFWRDNTDAALYDKLAKWHEAYQEFTSRYPRTLHDWDKGYKQFCVSTRALNKKKPLNRPNAELVRIYEAHASIPNAWRK